MSTTTLSSALAERVHAAMAAEDSSALDHGGTYPTKPDEAYLSTFELDCREWGIMYGFAYGIARGEDPYESVQSVGERALEAATEAWKRYGNDDVLTGAAYWKSRAGDRPKDLAEAIKPLMDVYEGLYGSRGQKPDLPQELMDALDKLARESG